MVARRRSQRDRERVRALVRSGWDRRSYRYRSRGRDSDYFGHSDRAYRTWLRPITGGVARGSAVLDLGCGNGVPTSRILARRFRVTGVDLSPVQVRRARRLVPRARFAVADMSEVDYPPGTFAAVVSLYSMIHVPREEHRRLLGRVARWLEPGGWLLLVAGHTAYEGTEPGWLGVRGPMFWSQYDAATYGRMLRSEGFRVLSRSFVPEGDGGHELFLARKRRRRPAPD